MVVVRYDLQLKNSQSIYIYTQLMVPQNVSYGKFSNAVNYICISWKNILKL